MDATVPSLPLRMMWAACLKNESIRSMAPRTRVLDWGVLHWSSSWVVW